MAVGSFFHHIGTFLLLLAVAFLIVTDVSAPVVNNIGLLTVNLPSGGTGGSEIAFGTFGYCIQDALGNDNDLCSESHVGYDPAAVVTATDGTQFGRGSQNTAKALTRVMVLHPVATALLFIAFLLALGAHMLGSFLASVVSALAFLVTLVALICDFVLFGIIKNHVNDQDNDSYAYFSVAMWTMLASAICSFLGTIIVFFTCCTGRVKRHRERRKVDTYTSPPRTRRRWW